MITRVTVKMPKIAPTMKMARSRSLHSGSDRIVNQSVVKRKNLTDTYRTHDAEFFGADSKVATAAVVAAAPLDFSKLKKRKTIKDVECRRGGGAGASVGVSSMTAPKTASAHGRCM